MAKVTQAKKSQYDFVAINAQDEQLLAFGNTEAIALKEFLNVFDSAEDGAKVDVYKRLKTVSLERTWVEVK